MINTSVYRCATFSLILALAFFAVPTVLATNDIISVTEPNPDNLYQQLTAVPSPIPNQSLDLSTLPKIEDVDLLAIDDEIKQILDLEIRPIHSKSEKARQLHRLLFHPMYLGITYNYGKTLTAQQAYNAGTGNCLSHASLYLAAARYVGLNAQFQIVDVPRDWLDRKDFYVVPGHINVKVSIPNNTVIVEFADAYSAIRTKLLKSERISEHQALAEYYNNIGMEYMEKKDYATAIAYMHKSTKTYRKVGSVWSNLGVAYKISGHLKLAQDAYEKGLKYDKRNPSIINNIYILYQQTGQMAKAEKLAKKVEGYSKTNPYYLEKLAGSDMSMGNYKHAVRLLRKAVHIKEDEPKFYLAMAFAYHQLGEYEKSISSVTLAQKHSVSQAEYDRYGHKLNVLRSYQAGL
ncbi:tetratricopeptide repeat protein [Teredinibacter haidensis]|uniref:tetratricopeptide repeat protein n=1 Tax=Teredinibacter haidensis TaxID=2731755 RepID=UPI000948D16F|nr:tetratricopeptide repeat protein [Teredinibacter haidensis]